MLKNEKRNSIIVYLYLSLALTMPIAANTLVSLPVVGQSIVKSETDIPNFPLPDKVESGTKVRIDGSMGLEMINQSLKHSFEKQFSGTKVQISVNGTEAALKGLLDGKVDIAAIARKLTAKEKAQGLKQVTLHREKIAIIVSNKNPFQSSLTIEQFAKIFRGEITDWSEIGGTAGKIQFIDHPLTSNTRNSFHDYPVFRSAEFVTGANAVKIPEDNITLIVKELGTDGISYARANQVSKLSDVRTLKIEGLAADNSKYPFSQPLVYVYNHNPSLAVANFLGFSTAHTGTKAIEAARDAESSAIALSELKNPKLETATNSIPNAESVDTNASSENSNVVNSFQTETLPTTNNSSQQIFMNHLTNRNTGFLIVFSLLPVFGLGRFLALRLKKKRQLPKEKIWAVETLSETGSSSASITQTTLITNQLAIPDEDRNNASDNTTIINTKSHPKQNTNSNLIISTSENEPILGNLNTLTTKSTNSTTEVSGKISDPTNSAEEVWDTEAPVAIVNTPYLEVKNILEQRLTNPELSTDDLILSLSELLEKPPEPPTQVSNISLLELTNIPININLETIESENSVSQLPEGSDTKTSSLELESDSEKNTDLKLIDSLSELLGLKPEATEIDLELMDNEVKNSSFNLSKNDLENQDEIKSE